jgi:hypothetical protein
MSQWRNIRRKEKVEEVEGFYLLAYYTMCQKVHEVWVMDVESPKSLPRKKSVAPSNGKGKEKRKKWCKRQQEHEHR